MMTLTPLSLSGLPARERIVQTAHALFYRDGIRATGIDKLIAQAKVSKVTFYRHFPSKNALIRTYLECRHQVWMAWFTSALQRHGAGVQALCPALAEWFANDAFRGCAFLNGVAEVGSDVAEAMTICLRHKQEMMMAIAERLPMDGMREQNAQAIALAVDGAIVRAQYGDAAGALQALNHVVTALDEQRGLRPAAARTRS